jgi:hypothetical protein
VEEGQLCLRMAGRNLRRPVQLKLNIIRVPCKDWPSSLDIFLSIIIIWTTNLTNQFYQLVNVETNRWHNFSSFALYHLRPVSSQALVVAFGFFGRISRPTLFEKLLQNNHQPVVDLFLYILSSYY